LTDALKAVLAVLIGGWLLSSVEGAALLGKYWAALWCLLGHMFPAMFEFKGGKGILSGGTIALMLDWRIALVVWVGFLILVLLTRYVSLGSVWAGISFPFATWFCYPDPIIVLLGFLCGGLVVWQHRSNIKRLVQGKENKFSFHRKS
ncbi:MAG: glycerol-3-phosphate acyltransferase, partial [Oscillibacter sp.]|nr:glycerol-3-phosphate acyltransferase [Oscillibacter sp.]